MILIGGGAASLAYGFSNVTKDLDTWTKLDSQLEKAFDAARAETGLAIPVEEPGAPLRGAGWIRTTYSMALQTSAF